ncbi:hypothetical protein PybrP1_009910, partial [[Pythium] brassicae (nom. inval.)]
MVSTSQILATVALAAAAASVPSVDAHGFVEVPKSTFPKGTKNPSEWILEFPPPWEGNWRDPKAFATASKQKGFATLRSFIENKGPLCGKNDPNAAPQPIPADNVVKFSRELVHAVRLITVVTAHSCCLLALECRLTSNCGVACFRGHRVRVNSGST